MLDRFDTEGFPTDDGLFVLYNDYSELQTQYDALSELLEKANDARQDAEVRAERAEEELKGILHSLRWICNGCAHKEKYTMIGNVPG